MKTVWIRGEEDLNFIDPIEVISGEINSDTPVTLSIFANDEKCYAKVIGWSKDRTRDDYTYKFSAVLNVFRFSNRENIAVKVMDESELLHEITVPMSNDLRSRLDEFNRHKERTRDWILALLKCPDCASEDCFDVTDDNIACRSCSAVFEQKTNALYMMRTDCRDEYSHEFPKQASWHEFPGGIQRKIEEVTEEGGKVLDFGGGFKTKYNPGVVSLELIDYPLVDLIASGDRIPIADESFDLVLCISVLEHVKDPFACAREIARVTKKGGQVLCVVPFMFALHAHPHHYYNMTSMGVSNLFEDNVIHDQVQFGHPIRTLCQVANIYYKSLPPKSEARKKFAELTVWDLVSSKFNGTEETDFIRELSEAGRETLAHGTRNWFTKK